MKYSREFSVGAVILVAAALLIYMSIAVGSLRMKSGQQLTLQFDDATGLVKNAPVVAAGIKVGAVSSLRYENGGATVAITIDHGVELKEDATAVIRARSLLGEKFIAIDPGRAGRSLGDRPVATLPQQDPILFVARLSSLLDAADPEELAGLMRDTRRFLAGGDGGKPPAQVLRELSDALLKLAESSEALIADGRTLVADGRVFMEKGKSFLDEGQTLIGEGMGLSKKADAALGSVARTSDKAHATLKSMDPAVADLPRVLSSLRRATTRLDHLLKRSENLTKGTLIKELRSIVQQEGIYVRLNRVKKR